MSPTIDAARTPAGGFGAGSVGVRVRPIGPADETALAAFYAGLSPNSRYRRFFAASSGLSAAQATFFCAPDHDHREGFVAEAVARGGGRVIVGHLCLEPAQALGAAAVSGPASAEVAVAVADNVQHRGIGRALLAAAIDWASRRGLARLTATILESNPAMVGLLRASGRPLSWRSASCGVMECSLDVDARDLAA